MFNIQYNGQTVQCREGEILLECLLRSGLNIDFSCKSGVCHRCLTKCVEGEIPEQASKKLPLTHRGQNYLLACQCVPVTAMTLLRKSAEDIVTKCMAVSLCQSTTQTWQLNFEGYRDIQYQTGQPAILTDLDMSNACMGTLVSNPETDSTLCIEISGKMPIAWMMQENESVEGVEFYLRGPLPIPSEPLQERLPPNPALWEQLGGDEKIRAVLTTFYQKVYTDPELSAFFERITMDRIIGKQFGFLKENIVGEAIYWGEQPKNAHHWMVINDKLFQHRAGLMRQALQEHDVVADLIEQLEAYENQFQPDIVKAQPWLKQIGDLVIDTEQYEECLLEEATVCDYCGAEIPVNTMVKFHKRIGKLACKTCSTTTLS